MNVSLSGRDKALLRALARFRIARTGDLVGLAFGNVRRDTAAARLRRLFDAGYVAVRSGGQAEQNLYSLGPEGRRWLRGQGQEPGPVPRGGLEHHLAIVRTWIDIAATVPVTTGLRLLSARPDWEMRGEAAGENKPIPDLLVGLAVEGVHKGLLEAALAVEVDRGTEPLWVLRRKLERYVAECGGGRANGLGFGVAIVLTRRSDKRMEGIVGLLDRVWPGWHLAWTLEDGPAEALASLFKVLENPLTRSPYRKGRETPVSHVSSMTPPARGEGL